MDNPLIYVSIVALLLKLLGTKVLYSRWYPAQAGYLIGLLLFFTILQNTIELAGYYFMLHPEHPWIPFLFHLFYIALTANLILIPLSMSALIFYKLKKFWFHIAAFVFIALTTLMCATDWILAGFQVYTYSITRIPGEYYYAYQAFILLMLAFTVYILSFARYFAKDNYNKGKAGNLILGFIPFALSIAAIVIAMALGTEINAAAIWPLSFSFFILVLAYNFGESRIVDLSVFIPFSKKFRLWFRVSCALIKHMIHMDSSFADSSRIAHREMILLTNDMFKTQKEAAEFLNMSESQYSRWLNKYRKS